MPTSGLDLHESNGWGDYCCAGPAWHLEPTIPVQAHLEGRQCHLEERVGADRPRPDSGSRGDGLGDCV